MVASIVKKILNKVACEDPVKMKYGSPLVQFAGKNFNNLLVSIKYYMKSQCLKKQEGTNGKVINCNC